MRTTKLKQTIRPLIYPFLISATLLFSSLPAQAFDLSWNGFGSAYVGKADRKDLLPGAFADTHVDVTHFSLMGLNLAGRINDDFSFASQFVALGTPVGTTDAFGLMAQWAFANYTPTENTSLKFGRQLFPIFLTSEYIRVGYLLPFRAVPEIFAGLSPFTRFDGVSATQSIATSFGKLSLEVFGGTPNLDINTNDLSSSVATVVLKDADMIGAQATLDGPGWRVHAVASRYYFTDTTTILANSSVSFLQGHPQEYSLGYRYDKNNIVTYGEWFAERDPHGTPTNGGHFINFGSGYYILGGYHIGKFMPHYTFASAGQEYNVLSPTTGTNANGHAKSHTFGFNYQAGQQAVIKVEWEHVILDAAQKGGYEVTQTTTSTATKTDALYAGVDFIF